MGDAEVVSEQVSESSTTETTGAPSPNEPATQLPLGTSTLAAPETPSEPLTADALFKDPRYARDLQAETDRRAAAQARALLQQEMTRTAQAREAQAAEAQKAAEASEREEARARLVQTASQHDPFVPEGYNDDAVVAKHNEIVTAQRKLAEEESAHLLRQTWEKEELPSILGWVQSTELQRVADGLVAQYAEGYIQIPELSDPELAQRVRHDNFEHAGNWVVNLVNEISNRRVEAALVGARAEHNTNFAERVAVSSEAKRVQDMAEFRATMPNPDTTPQATGHGMAFRTQIELEAAHVAGQLGHLNAYQIADMKSRLPYGGDEEG